MQKEIFIKGARENNLKNIDVTIPRDKLVVLTGLSGSGKSSLAFDTIYAEGQRRYVESLSSYARMFLGQMDKPDVDYIDGLSPAISIDQKTTSKNPRSTVGTVTEIYDYLRLLWARVGVPHCPKCGREIRQQTVDQIIDQIMALPEGTRIQVMAPVVRGRKGEHAKVLEDARRSELDCIRLVEQPALRLVLLRDSVKFNSYLWLERSIRKIEQDQKLPLSYIGKVGVGISGENLKSAEFGHYDLVFLVLEEDDVYEGRVETLPPCRCAAVRFRGDHSRAPQYYEQLAQFLAANGLQIAGFSREITLIDNCISDDPAQYVTEIRVPVARG